MKILLLGKNGQLGKEILNLSIEYGYEVAAYSHSELDVTNYKKVAKVIKEKTPDIIINTTALHASVGETYPEQLFTINSFAIHNLATIAKENDIKFVTYSTDYVFDGLKGSPYLESDKPNPLQMYGLSKYAGELVATNYNSDSLVIRTCGVYGGIKGSRAKGNFVLNMLKEAKDSKEIEVSSEQIVSPSYAFDVAKATLELINKNPKGGIYHLVNSGFCSWSEFTQEIMNIKRLKIKVRPVNRNGISGGIRRPIFSALKNTKAKKLGIELPSWKNALKRYIESLPQDL